MAGTVNQELGLLFQGPNYELVTTEENGTRLYTIKKK